MYHSPQKDISGSKNTLENGSSTSSLRDETSSSVKLAAIFLPKADDPGKFILVTGKPSMLSLLEQSDLNPKVCITPLDLAEIDSKLHSNGTDFISDGTFYEINHAQRLAVSDLNKRTVDLETSTTVIGLRTRKISEQIQDEKEKKDSFERSNSTIASDSEEALISDITIEDNSEEVCRFAIHDFEKNSERFGNKKAVDSAFVFDQKTSDHVDINEPAESVLKGQQTSNVTKSQVVEVPQVISQMQNNDSVHITDVSVLDKYGNDTSVASGAEKAICKKLAEISSGDGESDLDEDISELVSKVCENISTTTKSLANDLTPEQGMIESKLLNFTLPNDINTGAGSEITDGFSKHPHERQKEGNITDGAFEPDAQEQDKSLKNQLNINDDFSGASLDGDEYVDPSARGPEVPKTDRGCPLKLKETNDSLDSEKIVVVPAHDSKVPKKGRGRPKRLNESIDSLDEEVSAHDPEVPKRGKGSPKKVKETHNSVDSDENVEASAHDQELPKGGRGRPKQVKETDNSVDGEENVEASAHDPEVSKRNRGHPKQVKETDNSIDGKENAEAFAHDPEVSKRGRGRPKQVKETDNSVDGEENIQASAHDPEVPKRGKGSPKKVKETHNSVDSEENVEASAHDQELPKRGRDRPKQVKETDNSVDGEENVEASAHDPEVSKRNRGRPKQVKETDNSVDGEENAEASAHDPEVSKRKKGRPKQVKETDKSVDGEENVEASAHDPEVPKQGRGCPKQVKETDNSVDGEENIEASAHDPEVSKRNRGRPEQVKETDNSVDSKENAEASAHDPEVSKRGSGRPKQVKETDNSVDGEENVEASAHDPEVPKQGRGRPKQVKETDNSVDGEENAEASAHDSEVSKRGSGRPKQIKETDNSVDGEENVDVSAHDPEVLKRSRDRPKKVKETDNSVDGVENVEVSAHDPEVPKRGRGRPKLLKETDNSVDGEENVDISAHDSEVPKRGRGRPKLVKETDNSVDGEENVDVSAHDPEVPKRGRGRPKKVKGRGRPKKVSVENVDVSAHDLEVPKRGRGRPKLVKETDNSVEGEENVDVSAHDPEVPKRGRGRPKKVKGRGRPKKVSVENVDVSAHDLEVPKRGRGRPKLVKETDNSVDGEENVEASAQDPEVPKRGRGRPKQLKETDNSVDGEENVEVSAHDPEVPKRGRGYPGKLNAADSSSDSEEKEKKISKESNSELSNITNELPQSEIEVQCKISQNELDNNDQVSAHIPELSKTGTGHPKKLTSTDESLDSLEKELDGGDKSEQNDSDMDVEVSQVSDIGRKKLFKRKSCDEFLDSYEMEDDLSSYNKKSSKKRKTNCIFENENSYSEYLEAGKDAAMDLDKNVDMLHLMSKCFIALTDESVEKKLAKLPNLNPKVCIGPMLELNGGTSIMQSVVDPDFEVHTTENNCFIKVAGKEKFASAKGETTSSKTCVERGTECPTKQNSIDSNEKGTDLSEETNSNFPSITDELAQSKRKDRNMVSSNGSDNNIKISAYVPDVSKRGRGCSKKQKNTLGAEENVPKVSKRGQGCPKKLKTRNSSLGSEEKETDSSNFNNSDSTNSDLIPSDTDELAQSKRKDRDKVSPNGSDNNVEISAHVPDVSKRGRGCSKKQKTTLGAEENVTASAHFPKASKQGRGHPKKLKTRNSSLDSEEKETDSSNSNNSDSTNSDLIPSNTDQLAQSEREDQDEISQNELDSDTHSVPPVLELSEMGRGHSEKLKSPDDSLDSEVKKKDLSVKLNSKLLNDEKVSDSVSNGCKNNRRISLKRKSDVQENSSEESSQSEHDEDSRLKIKRQRRSLDEDAQAEATFTDECVEDLDSGARVSAPYISGTGCLSEIYLPTPNDYEKCTLVVGEPDQLSLLMRSDINPKVCLSDKMDLSCSRLDGVAAENAIRSADEEAADATTVLQAFDVSKEEGLQNNVVNGRKRKRGRQKSKTASNFCRESAFEICLPVPWEPEKSFLVVCRSDEINLLKSSDLNPKVCLTDFKFSPLGSAVDEGSKIGADTIDAIISYEKRWSKSKPTEYRELPSQRKMYSSKNNQIGERASVTSKRGRKHLLHERSSEEPGITKVPNKSSKSRKKIGRRRKSKPCEPESTSEEDRHCILVSDRAEPEFKRILTVSHMFKKNVIGRPTHLGLEVKSVAENESVSAPTPEDGHLSMTDAVDVLENTAFIPDTDRLCKIYLPVADDCVLVVGEPDPLSLLTRSNISPRVCIEGRIDSARWRAEGENSIDADVTMLNAEEEGDESAIIEEATMIATLAPVFTVNLHALPSTFLALWHRLFHDVIYRFPSYHKQILLLRQLHRISRTYRLPTMYSWENCFDALNNKISLCNDMRINRKDKLYRCTICDKDFLLLKLLKYHMKIFHDELYLYKEALPFHRKAKNNVPVNPLVDSSVDPVLCTASEDLACIEEEPSSLYNGADVPEAATPLQEDFVIPFSSNSEDLLKLTPLEEVLGLENEPNGAEFC